MTGEESMLHDYLPEVRREAARTEMVAHDLRHELNSRVELCERLLAELEGGLTGSS